VDRKPFRLGGLAALLALAGAAAVPLLTDNPYYLQKVQMAGILVIAVQGLNLMAGYAGQVSLGHAGLFAVGAYTAAKLALSLGWGFVGDFAGAVVMTMLVGLLLGVPALRVRHHYLAVLTIGFGIMVEKLANEGGSFTGGFAGLTGIPGVILFGRELDAVGTYYVILALAAGLTWGIANMARSRVGRAFLALREGEVAAESLGISEYRYKLLAFVLGSLGAGMAGALYAHVFRYVSPESFTFGVSVEMLVMLLVGGMGTVAGPVLGVGLIQALPELIAGLDAFRLIIYGGILLLAVIFLPGGLVSLLPRRWREPSEPMPDKGELERLEEQAVELLRRAPGPADVPALEVQGLTKYFGGIKALDGVSLRVEDGTIHALIGPNGSGKTTCLHAISGIYRPSGGAVFLRGQEITGRKAYQLAGLGLARTFQRSQIFPRLTVLENVLVGQHSWRRTDLLQAALGLPGARREEREAREFALGLLSLVGLADRANQEAGSLPHGLQRLLEIARALAARPAVLLLDEPAAGLSEPEGEELERLLRRIKELGITILLVEHDMRLVMGISDTVTVLDSGQVICSGAPEAVQSDPRVLSAYLGDAAAD